MTTATFTPFDQRNPASAGGDPLTRGFSESTTTLIVIPNAGVPAVNAAAQLAKLLTKYQLGNRHFSAEVLLDDAIKITVPKPDAPPVFCDLLETDELVASVNGLPVRRGRKPVVTLASATPT